MHRVLWLAIALVACKSQGTITLDFDLDGSACAAFAPGSASAPIDHYVLYSVLDETCTACACGACAGMHRTVLTCPEPDGTECTLAALGDRSIVLDPGLWTVVLEAYGAGGSAASLLASQCIAVVVHQDGQMDGMLAPGSDGCQACNN